MYNSKDHGTSREITSSISRASVPIIHSVADHLAQDTLKKNDFPRSRRQHTLVRLDDPSVFVPPPSNFLADPSPTLRTDWLPPSGYGATG